MSSRQLTEHQKRQVKTVQARHYQEDTHLSPEAIQHNERKGRVCAVYKNTVEIYDSEGLKHRCNLRTNLGSIVVGDRVVWQLKAGEEDGVVLAVFPRRKMLKRKTSGGTHLVVANLDRLLIMLAPEPKPTCELLDSLLVIAEISKIPVSLIINKIDLPSAKGEVIEQMLSPYRSFNYPMIEISALKKINIDAIRSLTDTGICALTGQSGVGKSTLINVLCPSQSAQTGDLNSKGFGSHTTTTAHLYKIPNGGCLVDLPGVRSFGLDDIKASSLASGFREFKPFLGKCQFRNCLHDKEPNCALKKAAREGTIHIRRLNQYRHFLAQLNHS